MKRYIINKYYNFLMWLEDILDIPSNIVHKHRVRVDEKYYEKYMG